MRYLAAATALIALAGCMGNQIEAGIPAQLTAKQIKIVDAGVRQALKDPKSARISGLSVSRDRKFADMFMVCGYVNGRNSYGGYTGDVPFYGHLTDFGGGFKFDLGGIGDVGDSNYGIRLVCAKSGAPI